MDLPAQQPAPHRKDTIRGTVTDERGDAIKNASIIVTRSGDFAVFQSTTDTLGVFSLTIAEGTGDYLLHVSAIGFQALRRRVSSDTSGRIGDSVFVQNVRLRAATQKLATVQVQANRPKPSRMPDSGIETGAAERTPDAFLGMLTVDALGDLASIAATQPGVLSVNGGYSVFGLGTDQNRTTLNGLGFTGTSLPRDAPVRTRVATSTYDPSRGGFSGGTIAIDALPGGVFSSLYAHASLDAPALQYTDRIGSQLGGKFTDLDASVGARGPLGYSDRYFYSYGVQADHRSAATASLLSAETDLLQHAGLSVDSVRRFLSLITAQQVPLGGSAAPTVLTTDQLRVLTRLDWAPVNSRTLAPPKETAGLLAIGNVTSIAPFALGPTATPGHAGEHTISRGQLQAVYSRYIGNDYLWETKTAVSAGRDHSLPHLAVPDAHVSIASLFGDATAGVSTLQFGGNGSQSVNSDLRQWSWESRSELQLYAPGRSSHKVKITADYRLDGFKSISANDAYGSFVFTSLADLAAQQPSKYTRTLSTPSRNGGLASGFASIGDLWRALPSLEILYGGRVEGERYTSTPARNTAVEVAFEGVRTDAAPRGLHVSPRVGFTWIRSGAASNGGIAANKTGVFNMGPTSYVRGGFGEFRNLPSAQLLSDAMAFTGLPDGARTVTCWGDAAPTPQWQDYITDAATIPRACQGSAALFTDAARAVELFSPNFAPPRSWRGNLSYTSQYRRLSYSVEGIYSWNQNQPGVVDLNFRDTPSFVLPGEGRPIFVPPTAIVQSTGVVSPVPMRVESAFGRVVDHRSDLTSVSRQVTFTVSPDLLRLTNWYGALSYTLGDARSLSRGFDASTFASPTVADWARSPLDVRHQFLARAGYAGRSAAFTLSGTLRSGLPFTPLVAGDINGDGLANDRAFVFDPAQVRDTDLRRDLRALLSGSEAARRCLSSQLGHAAGVNSCQSPWVAQLNAEVTLVGRALHLPNRVTQVALSFANPLAGIDQLVHGAGRLRGWGVQAFPDPILYEVRGFDPTARAFRYVVNPRFGTTSPSLTTFRAPFRATLDVALDLGRDVSLQQIERALKPGRRGYPGPRLSLDEIKQRYALNIPEPYGAIVADPDSLLLSKQQFESIQAAREKWLVARDNLLREFAEYIASLGESYDVSQALARQEDLIARGYEMARVDVQATLPSIMSPIQLQMVPGVASVLLRAKPGEGPGGRTYRP